MKLFPFIGSFPRSLFGIYGCLVRTSVLLHLTLFLAEYAPQEEDSARNPFQSVTGQARCPTFAAGKPNSEGQERNAMQTGIKGAVVGYEKIRELGKYNRDKTG